MNRAKAIKNIKKLTVMFLIVAAAIGTFYSLVQYYSNKQYAKNKVSYLESLNNADYLGSQKKKIAPKGWFHENVGWCKDGSLVFASIHTTHGETERSDINVYYIPSTGEHYFTTEHLCTGWTMLNMMGQPADIKEFRKMTK